MTEPAHSPPVLSVSDLARQARILIEERFGFVAVEGELSNFRRPGSGHWYFTLKDQSAQIRCAMFAGRNRHTRVKPSEGMQVLIRGRVSLYEARGDFQIIVDAMEPAGEGALRAAFEALKEKLAAQGIFDDSRKRPLPAIPRHMTIISSPTGAALKDVLHVVERRFPALAVTLIESQVQGDGAGEQLTRALHLAADLDTDVVLITRGGGSLEDLWAFNREDVVLAITACPHPVISAVGHQTDVTIADFAADVRAPTPSAGAELATPSSDELSTVLSQHARRMARTLTGDVRMRSHLIAELAARLTDPRARLEQQMQKADELENRLRLAWVNRQTSLNQRLAGAQRSLGILQPTRLLANLRQRLVARHQRLTTAMEQGIRNRQSTLASSTRTLQTVSPLSTLARGYAVLTAPGGIPVTTVNRVVTGDTLTAHLKDGALDVSVANIDSDNRLPLMPDETHPGSETKPI